MKYDFKSFLDVKRQIDDQLSARCPFHNDRSPSFSANTDTGLWKCFAGCGQGNFAQFLERIASDPEAGIRTSRTSKSQRYVRDEGFKTVATYQYMSTDGEYHLRVTRQEKSTGEKRFFQEHMDEVGRWTTGGATKTLFPYLFHEWNTSDLKLIFLVEGEKCVEFLKSKGLLATTVAGGSSKWLPHYGLFFKDRQVIILPDLDEVGQNFARLAHANLSYLKVQTCLVNLPNLNPGEDIVEWLSHHGTIKDLFNLIESSCSFLIR